MANWLVTVKVPKNPEHNPRCKVTGRCPVPPHGICTDVTGQHHTVLVVASSAEEGGGHLSRVAHHPHRTGRLKGGQRG